MSSTAQVLRIDAMLVNALWLEDEEVALAASQTSPFSIAASCHEASFASSLHWILFRIAMFR